MDTDLIYLTIWPSSPSTQELKKVDHYGNYTRHVDKNIPLGFILPSRWQDGAESLGRETTVNVHV